MKFLVSILLLYFCVCGSVVRGEMFSEEITTSFSFEFGLDARDTVWHKPTAVANFEQFGFSTGIDLQAMFRRSGLNNFIKGDIISTSTSTFKILLHYVIVSTQGRIIYPEQGSFITTSTYNEHAHDIKFATESFKFVNTLKYSKPSQGDDVSSSFEFFSEGFPYLFMDRECRDDSNHPTENVFPNGENIDIILAQCHIPGDNIETDQMILYFIENDRKYASSGCVIKRNEEDGKRYFNGSEYDNLYRIRLKERLFQPISEYLSDDIVSESSGSAVFIPIAQPGFNSLTISNRDVDLFRELSFEVFDTEGNLENVIDGVGFQRSIENNDVILSSQPLLVFSVTRSTPSQTGNNPSIQLEEFAQLSFSYFTDVNKDDDLGIFLWDGFDWRLLGLSSDGSIDYDSNLIQLNLSSFSTYAVFRTHSEIFNLRPNRKIITPNGDGTNDTALFDGLSGKSVVIKIFDITSRLIRTIDAHTMDKAEWDGKNDNGQVVENGVYIYQFYYQDELYGGLIAVAK